MDNNIQSEFEQYIQKLTQTICKNIFLEDLKNICDEFKAQLLIYQNLIAKAEETNDEIKTHTSSDHQALELLSKNVDSKLTTITEVIDGINKQYKETFFRFSTEITALNNNERQKFVGAIDQTMENHINMLTHNLSEGSKNISKKLETSIITPALLQESINRVSKPNSVDSPEIEKKIALLNSYIEKQFNSQKKLLEQQNVFIQKSFMEQQNTADTGIPTEAIDLFNKLEKQVDGLKKQLAESIRNQKNLLNKPFTEATRLIRNWEEKHLVEQKEIDKRKLQESSRDLHLLVGQCLLIALLGIVIVITLLEPWKTFGVDAVALEPWKIVASGVFGSILLIFIIRGLFLIVRERKNVATMKKRWGETNE